MLIFVFLRVLCILEMSLRIICFVLIAASILKPFSCQTTSYNDILNEINTPVTLACPSASNNYYWYKSPNTLLINPLNPTATIDSNFFTLSGSNLILNNANRTDIGTNMYYAYDPKLKAAYCYFSVYLYRKNFFFD